MENDRFDELWAAMKQRVCEARGERACGGDAFYTMGENVMAQRWGSRVFVGTPTMDENGKEFVNIHTSTTHASMMTSAYAEDLVNIAAHCMAAAQDIHEASEVAKQQRA